MSDSDVAKFHNLSLCRNFRDPFSLYLCKSPEPIYTGDLVFYAGDASDSGNEPILAKVVLTSNYTSYADYVEIVAAYGREPFPIVSAYSLKFTEGKAND